MNSERIKVLYVDDERNNLQAFKALFRKDYDILLAESAEEGLKVLEKEVIHVIICDQRMPGMTGVEFFESILEKFPYPIRILLTGYTDIQAVIEAINRGQIYRFIDKPWDQQVIAVAIQNAYEIYHTRFLLREQNMQLKKAYNELDKFVYSASHDLRAPLASILGLIKVMKLEEVDKENRYVDMIEATVNKMDIFVQNIIKYYRANKVDVEINHIKYAQLIDEILFDLQRHISEWNVIVTKDLSEPVFNWGDENRVRIILSNIILNAIRFHDEHKTQHQVKISLSTNIDHAVIVVEDNGVGISAEYHSQIFDMFFRGAHKNAGSGVGLYVANEALKRIKGEVEIESDTNQGTKIMLRIPNLA